MQQCIDIVLSTNGVHILANVIIVNPTWTYIILRAAILVMDHAKGMFYYNQHPHDRFLLLIMEVFGYLHQQAKTFLFQCANMVPLVKSNICLLLLVLWAFYRQKVVVTLQRTQASSILRWTGVTNKASSKLEVIWRFFPLFLFDWCLRNWLGVCDLDLDRCLYFPFTFKCHIGFRCWSSLCVLPFPFWIGVFFYSIF